MKLKAVMKQDGAGCAEVVGSDESGKESIGEFNITTLA